MTKDAAILRELHQAVMPLLPGELGDRAGMTPTELTNTLHRLRGAGFDIEAHPSRGWRLLSAPDRLLADDLQARLGTNCPLAREILVFAETGSTNDVASRLGREGHPGGVAIFAERQTSGRGRFGRRWDSADHAGLWCSVLLRPAWPLIRWPRLTIWAGVAVATVAERFTGTTAKIKWPNDVLLDGKKVAGILIESATDERGTPFAVVGIGINANQIEFPPELAGRAASLRQIAGATIDRAALAAALLRELDGQLATAATGPALITAATQRSSLLGSWIRLQAGTTTIEGTAETLDEEGNLMLRLADGTLHRASAGEVTSQTA